MIWLFSCPKGRLATNCIKIQIRRSNMEEEKVQDTNTQPTAITLDGQPATLVQINEARNKPGVKIKEESPGVYKTLQRLNG